MPPDADTRADNGDPLVRAVRRALRRLSFLDAGHTIVCAVSGGPDSLALLAALADIRAEHRFRLIAAHVHHGLRGAAADDDAAFVRREAERMGVRALVLRAGARIAAARAAGNTGGIENVAREARYALLLRAARRTGSDAVLVAHTADDQAETMLLRLCRGTGTRGLGAMKPIARRAGILLLRPFLGVTRADVVRSLARRGLVARADETNIDESRERNWMRRRVLPILRERYGARLPLRWSRAAALIRADERALGRMMERAFREVCTVRPREIALDAQRLATYDRAVQRSVVRRVIERLVGTVSGVSVYHVDSVLSLGRAALSPPLSAHFPLGRPGGTRLLPLSVRAAVRGAEIVVATVSASERAPLEHRSLPVPGTVTLLGGSCVVTLRVLSADAWPGPEPNSSWSAYFDVNALALPLAVRAPQAGDRLRPFGFGGSRKISDILSEAGVPRHARARQLVVEDERSILWIPGVRRSDRAPITPATKRILEVSVRWAIPTLT
jgi:tRNA(Ile)-lysidine synthase